MTRLDQALDLLRLSAQDKGQEICGYIDVDSESVCLLRKGHKKEHVLESARRIVPIE